jgi:hypothetical protein
VLQTYEGVIQRGSVRLPSDVDLPDGTRVYVTVVPTLDERHARRKAAIWLAENVGDMIMPGSATLVRQGQRQVWRFPAMLGSPFDEPSGPLGYVDVDAEAGTVLAASTLAKELVQNAERIDSPTPTSKN